MKYMPNEKTDAALFVDILKAAEETRQFTKGFTHAAYLKDLKTQRAVERDLAIIGEAAHGLTEKARKGLDEIPWQPIIGLRNRLIHNYGNIDPNWIWDIVQKDLPLLVRHLKKRI